MDDQTKACPFCAETIKAAAIVCKHCGRDLPAVASPVPESDQDRAARYGISFEQDRWIYQGNHFKDLGAAIAFAEERPDNPAISSRSVRVVPVEPKRIRWWLWLPMGLVVAFFGLPKLLHSSAERAAISARADCERAFPGERGLGCDKVYADVLRRESNR